MTAPPAGSNSHTRIRVLIRRFYPIVGGMERQCQAVCSRLVERGADIEVWTRHIASDTAAVESLDGFTIRRIRPGGLGRWGEYGSLPVLAVKLIRERKDYDVAVVFGSGWLALAVGWAAQRVGQPWLFRPATAGDVTRFLDPDAAPPGGSGGRLRRWLRGHLPPPGWRVRRLRAADAVVAISQEIADELLHWGFPAARVRRIPNGVDTARFHPADAQGRAQARAALGLPADAVIAIFLGRLVARKGVVDLVSAWHAAEAAGNLPPAHLVIAGSGAGQSDSVEADIRRAVCGPRRGAEERRHIVQVRSNRDKVNPGTPDDRSPHPTPSIHMAGTVTDPALWLSAADIFVLPSYGEGLSNALLEAMATGLAIVATDLPSTRAVAEPDRVAWLYPPGDVDALASVLRQAIEDPADRARRGQAARAQVEAELSLDIAAKLYWDLLVDLSAR